MLAGNELSAAEINDINNPAYAKNLIQTNY